MSCHVGIERQRRLRESFLFAVPPVGQSVEIAGVPWTRR